jgi:hypothetical protein
MDMTKTNTTGIGPKTGMTKCAVAFRRGLLVGLFATAAVAAILFWAGNSVHPRAPLFADAQQTQSR